MTIVTPENSPLVLRNNDGKLELWFDGVRIPGILGFRFPQTERGQRAIIEVVFTAKAVRFETHVRTETTSGKRVMDAIDDPETLRARFEAVFPPATAAEDFPDTGACDPDILHEESADPTCAASGAGCNFVYMNRFKKWGCEYCGRDATEDEMKHLNPPAEAIPAGYTFDPMTGIFGRFHDGTDHVEERSHFHHKWYSRRHEFPPTDKRGTI
ncbi:hypothetical protein HMSP1_10 [Sinorhizobium phage HMSP1-Susan]|nr:hypothetical protein HMSP1_10 [Sinorhizobium phage HMSP1-Susan]